MALSQRLEFRQSQALVMTPQLMQAIKLLQLSNLDLTAYVEGELEKNPLLERPSEAPAEANQPNEGTAAGATEGSGEAQEGQDGEWAKGDVTGSAAIEDSFDTGIENVFPDSAEAPPRPTQTEPAAYSEWAGVGSGGGRTATTIWKPSCRPKRRSRIISATARAAIAAPVRRMIGRH